MFTHVLTMRKWLFNVSDKAAKSCRALDMTLQLASLIVVSYLCFARLSVMVRHTNIIKDPMQLVDDIVDLGGQVTRVDRHGEYEYMSRNPKASSKRKPIAQRYGCSCSVTYGRVDKTVETAQEQRMLFKKQILKWVVQSELRSMWVEVGNSRVSPLVK